MNTEIIFDCLIANVAQKFAKIEFVENHEENEKNFQNFSIFAWFSTNSIFFEVLSYTSNQVVKNYLLDQEDRLARTIWTYARLFAKKPRARPLL